MPPSPDVRPGIEQCNCFLMRKAARQITRLYDSYLEPAGLRITQFLLIAALNDLQVASVNQLAELLDIERTAMGKMVGFLEKDGLVTVNVSPTDGRIRNVTLTKQGVILHGRAVPLWRKAQEQFESLNGAARTKALRRSVEKMVAGDADGE